RRLQASAATVRQQRWKPWCLLPPIGYLGLIPRGHTCSQVRRVLVAAYIYWFVPSLGRFSRLSSLRALRELVDRTPWRRQAGPEGRERGRAHWLGWENDRQSETRLPGPVVRPGRV